MNDRELAVRFPDGDDATIRAVYERFGRAVYTVAYSILHDPARAAEATQAAFVSAWQAASRFDGDHELGPWLYTIARRAAIDAYRRERRLEPVDPGDLDARPAAEPLSLERAWEAWQVRLAIDQLPEDEREVVRLSWYEGLTHPEIAEMVGAPVGTVKSRSHRAHRRLAAALEHVRSANRSAPRDVPESDSVGTPPADRGSGAASERRPARGEAE